MSVGILNNKLLMSDCYSSVFQFGRIWFAIWAKLVGNLGEIGQ